MSVSMGAGGAPMDYEQLVDNTTNELKANLAAVDTRGVQVLLDELSHANKIAVYGVGREGLAMKGFAMRLFHMGLRVSVVGEMTSMPIGSGDLLIVSAGPGYFSTVSALSAEAQRAGTFPNNFVAVSYTCLRH